MKKNKQTNETGQPQTGRKQLGRWIAAGVLVLGLGIAAAVLIAGGGARTPVDRPSGSAETDEQSLTIRSRKELEDLIVRTYCEAEEPETQENAEEERTFLQRSILNFSTFKIISFQPDRAVVRVISADMRRLVEECLAEVPTDSDVPAYEVIFRLQDRIFQLDDSAPKRSFDAVVEFDEQGRVIDTYALSDAFFGGLYSYLAEAMADSAGGGGQ